jgi:hypothetical protein
VHLFFKTGNLIQQSIYFLLKLATSSTNKITETLEVDLQVFLFNKENQKLVPDVDSVLASSVGGGLSWLDFGESFCC